MLINQLSHLEIESFGVAYMNSRLILEAFLQVTANIRTRAQNIMQGLRNELNEIESQFLLKVLKTPLKFSEITGFI